MYVISSLDLYPPKRWADGCAKIIKTKKVPRIISPAHHSLDFLSGSNIRRINHSDLPLSRKKMKKNAEPMSV
jgi:hypothetical protein